MNPTDNLIAVVSLHTKYSATFVQILKLICQNYTWHLLRRDPLGLEFPGVFNNGILSYLLFLSYRKFNGAKNA